MGTGTRVGWRVRFRGCNLEVSLFLFSGGGGCLSIETGFFLLGSLWRGFIVGLMRLCGNIPLRVSIYCDISSSLDFKSPFTVIYRRVLISTDCNINVSVALDRV